MTVKVSVYIAANLNGGATIERFLDKELVNEMTITTIPILIGAGLLLFGPLDREVNLELLKSESFQNGVVQNEYKVIQK
jgi:dihydrofolate reductase